MRLQALAILVVVFALTGAAWADDLADFNAAVEAASAHNRVAIEYLRNGNADLAAMELDRMRAAWAKVATRKRPAVFAGDALYTIVMTDIATRLVTADMMLNMGQPENARQSLLGIRKDLYICASPYTSRARRLRTRCKRGDGQLMGFDSADVCRPRVDTSLRRARRLTRIFSRVRWHRLRDDTQRSRISPPRRRR